MWIFFFQYKISNLSNIVILNDHSNGHYTEILSSGNVTLTIPSPTISQNVIFSDLSVEKKTSRHKLLHLFAFPPYQDEFNEHAISMMTYSVLYLKK